MKYRAKVRLVAVAAAFTSIVSLTCGTPASPDEVHARLDALFSDLHRRGLFDGAVVVGSRSEPEWQKGYGFANVERRVPFTPDVAADGASLAKTFTAALTIGLATDRRLDLDEPAQRWLPELPYPDITLRHLLSHSSGLPVLDYDYFDAFLPKGQVRTTELLLGVIGSRKPPLAFAPGTAFEYSSFGYDLAALAAARAAGRPLAELLNERIFQPLGLKSAFLRPGRFADFPGIRTLGYGRTGGLNDVFDFEAFHGGSNIYISAGDLHRWNTSFLSRPVLNAGGLAASLERARIGSATSGLTLGSWYRSSDGDAFWYSGHLQGFHSEVFRNLRWRRSIVYMSNNTIPAWLQKAIVRAVDRVVRGDDPAPLIPPPADGVRKDERDALAGAWPMSDGDAFSIVRDADHLAALREGVRYRMVQVEPAAFYVPGLDVVVTFGRGAGGTISKIRVASNVDERAGER